MHGFNPRRLALLAGAGILAAATSVGAQGFPDKPVTLIVPYAAGGGTDILARVLGKAMGDELGHPVLIENRPGASGMIGANLAARAAPSGYTLVMMTSTLVIQTLKAVGGPSVGLDSFQPVGLIATAPMALSVSPGVPSNSLSEFIDYARANQGKLNYATFGKGSVPHLVTEQMNTQLGLQMVDVSYQGAAPASLDLARGEVQVFCDILSTALPLAKEGRTKMLALMSSQRSSSAPGVPTFAEAGYPDIKADVLIGISAPAGTPEPTVERLNAALAMALRDEQVIGRIRSLSLEPGDGAKPRAFAERMLQERDKWKQLIEKLHLRIE